MIRSLKYIKGRIRGIENTKKVTSAMQMISVAKLNRSEKALYSFRPYFSKFESLLYSIINSNDLITHCFFDEVKDIDKICLCVITSDNGLCAGYNNDIINCAEDFIKGIGKDKVGLVCIGRKGYNYFQKNGFNIINSYLGLNGRFKEEIALDISSNLIKLFSSAKFGKIYIAYTHFKTALIHKPIIEKFLNIDKKPDKKIDYIYEPEAKIILDETIQKYMNLRLKLIILEAFTAEHSIRAVAMKMATDNAKELLENLNLLKNKVRQANITQELMEVISSSEALKG